ncbi:TonB-dependent receptor domain-containing protein [Luteimonas sp. WGS1318]|uniref:TonB-dependent receptor domain-containing protein n=1 Tax=Luteimonas sp. WGS1318 TaxID=3366815 RepID=UPI00372CF4DD
MALRTNKLRDAITFALVVSGTTIAGMGVAQAQAVPAAGQEATTLDRVEVTGTRIRQVDTETAQPVVLIDRAAIERQGFQSVADILQNISAVGTPPISRASPLSAGENAGGTFISLRNLGAARSLVLVNGRRLGISTSGLADVSQIPAVAVERIEVLKDGASSIYGSDAIAGVINIITRANYDGAAASAYYGQYSEGDGAITKGDFIIGFTGDRGSLTLAAEYAKEDPVRSSDRPYSAFPRGDLHPTDNWTTVGQIGGFVSPISDALPGVTYVAATSANPNRNTRVIYDPLTNTFRSQNTATGGCAQNSLANPGPGICTPGSVVDKSNTNEQTDLRTGLEKKAFYVDGTYDLTDNIRFRTNVLYNNRVSDRTVAGYPMQAASFGTTMSADSAFNPLDRPITNWWRRTWEVPRVSTADLTTYRFSAALEGSFDLGDRFFDWDVSYLSSTNKVNQKSYGNLNLANTRAAVGPSFLQTAAGPTQGQIVCGTPGAVITGCVPWNPFLAFGQEGPGSLTDPALQRFLFQEEHSTGETETNVFAANLAGSVFTLPAGDLGFAVGVESRKEKGEFVPDALAVTGGSTNLAAGPTGGSYRVNEIYGELEIPVLADMPFARELSLNVATRYSDYDTFGDTTNDKFGIKWRPFDQLLLRATVADGFRAPTIADLYGGGSQTFSFYTDPCDTSIGSSANNATTRANCVAELGALANTYRQLGQGGTPVTAVGSQSPIAFSSGANPALTPEESKSQTIGLVWSPTFAQGLNFAFDWWKVRIDSTIVTDAPTTILDDCYVRGDQARCSASAASEFTRDPTTGQINFFRFSSINAGFRKVEGFDFDVSYRYSTDNLGSFAVASNTTYTAKDYYTSTDTPQYPITNVGLAGAPGTGTTNFRIRSNLNLSWDMGDFGVSWTARYYSKMREGCTYVTGSPTGVPPVVEPHLECTDIVFAPTGALTAAGQPASGLSRRREVGSNTFNDVQIRYNAPWDATIAIGANNVFDKVGPLMYTQPSSNTSYYGGFDIGRFLYMRYTQRF